MYLAEIKKLGLSTVYHIESRFIKLVRSFMTPPFLPEDQILQCNLYRWGLYKWGTSLSGAILFYILSFPFEWTCIRGGVVGNGGPRIFKFIFTTQSNLYIWGIQAYFHLKMEILLKYLS